MKKTIIVTISFIISFTMNTYSQVTIGSTEIPEKGAILQLKNTPDVTDGSANSTQGLLLPRVNIIKRSENVNLANTIRGAQNENYNVSEHIGLLVYNVNDDPCPTIKDGIYVWTGEQWESVPLNCDDPLESETTTTLTDRQGNVYPIANFGEAGTWMTQNLRTTIQPGAQDPITEGFLPGNPKMYYVFPNVEFDTSLGAPSTWKPEYGLLYNWNAATNNDNCSDNEVQHQLTPGDYSNPNPIQGICPCGWHIPNDAEWNLLQKTLTLNAPLYSDLTSPGVWDMEWETQSTERGGVGIDGIVMKTKNRLTTPQGVEIGLPTGGQSNSSEDNGFDVLLVGEASVQGPTYYGSQAFFWTSSSVSPLFAYYRSLTHFETGVGRSVMLKNRFFSVRCKKDNT